MRTPVFRFEAEVLTDAPFEAIGARLAALGSPSELRALHPLQGWQPMERHEDRLVLRWRRTWGGSEESGALSISPDPKGAHLRLEGRLKGWTGFVLLGLLRWKTDGLLDRFVEEL
ncbi:hypothetical protein GETHPA_06480 [Geothrix rubra]|uniref:SRPBCC family protein n=1 Tax=Geothrix rubra TaxID=2927977 RepID=A0ABQ5Q2X8_9BACT|nr:hypothetical protein [Geothrix rubra]GLH69115.1 hypothetical protein GETHPA_06480 [Geothrix rubra]